MKLPINLNEIDEYAPDPCFKYGYEDALGGLLRQMRYTDPQQQKRYDDGYDEGLVILEAEREARWEERE
jgi:hypothetical protein